MNVRIRQEAITFPELVVALGVILVLASILMILMPNFARARAGGQLTRCKSNLKEISVACEMYSTDFQGRYPPSLQALPPDYIKTIPTCPSHDNGPWFRLWGMGKAGEYVYACALPGDAGSVWCPHHDDPAKKDASLAPRLQAARECEQTKMRLQSLVDDYARTRTKGRYPDKLDTVLTAAEVSAPTCGDGGAYQYSNWIDSYTIVCGGLGHTAAGLDTPNYPQYTSKLGVVLRP